MTTKIAPSQPTEAGTASDDLQQPLSAGVLKLLLKRIGVSVQDGALNKACGQVEQEMQGATASKRLTAVIKMLQLKGVQAAQLNWSRFDQRRLPAMVLHQQQWQLVEKSVDGLLLVTNANGDSNELQSEELDNQLLLWLRSTPQAQQKSAFFSRGNIAARLVLNEVFKERRWLRDTLIASLVVNILAIATPVFAMQVYDRVVPTLAYATLHTLVAGMVIIIILNWLLKTVRARILDSVSCAVDKAVSQQVFDHVMGLQLDTRPRSLGTLAAQVGGLDQVRQFFTSSVVFSLVDLPFAVMFIGFIALVGGPIAWVYVLLLPVAILLGWMTQRRLRRLMQQQMMRTNERQGLLVDAIQGAESIRSNNAGWRFSEQWKDITKTISQYNIQQKAISNQAMVTTNSLAMIAFVSAIVVGVGQIEAGNLTMGALIACSLLGGRVIAPIAQSVQFFAQWQNVSQALQMVNQVLLQEKERPLGKTLLLPDQAPDQIELEGLTFSYPQSPIKQLSISQLSFKQGERVALLGPVGSGKSTLLKVLAGLYRPSAGRVRLGNADLWEIDPNIVANHVGYLPQSVHMFKGTLRSNLDLSGVAGDSHLLHVCELLGIDKIAADNPLGMDLEISEGGEGLSGGQRQLVGLGRVLLGQPKIWLLDEPTSSLDVETEKQVFEAIQSQLKPEDILILSTHRPGLAAQLANRVVVVNRGEVIEDGKPDTVIPKLMAKQSAKRAKNQQATHAKLAQMNKGLPNVI
ncbi:ATP-binding cassette domain-containing protein [Aliiglaciecola sp. LCG003]|uniref:ATP-binding cassette domain-containing protein n=1 Tax=Aliiglaciecola sp. LCG003 TaxID=3053655 RepID=UPI002573F209|nr:ATP-binding cassette domain-containing protein [Aliiglaciecola sp. LCG003]WJG09307.1 ATP-binding cassette domain-containing protein [Aliiglaciecola sp. LCG003]